MFVTYRVFLYFDYIYTCVPSPQTAIESRIRLPLLPSERWADRKLAEDRRPLALYPALPSSQFLATRHREYIYNMHCDRHRFSFLTANLLRARLCCSASPVRQRINLSRWRDSQRLVVFIQIYVRRRIAGRLNDAFFVWPSARPLFRPSVRPCSVHPFVRRPFVRPSAHPFVRPSAHSFVRPSVRPSVRRIRATSATLCIPVFDEDSVVVPTVPLSIWDVWPPLAGLDPYLYWPLGARTFI